MIESSISWLTPALIGNRAVINAGFRSAEYIELDKHLWSYAKDDSLRSNLVVNTENTYFMRVSDLFQCSRDHFENHNNKLSNPNLKPSILRPYINEDARMLGSEKDLRFY